MEIPEDLRERVVALTSHCQTYSWFVGATEAYSFGNNQWEIRLFTKNGVPTEHFEKLNQISAPYEISIDDTPSTDW